MGLLFKIPAFIVYAVAGLWGFLVCLGIVIDNLGFIGGAIAFFIFPVTIAFAPWYAAIGEGNWFPLILIYGGGFGATILCGIGSIIDRD